MDTAENGDSSSLANWLMLFKGFSRPQPSKPQNLQPVKAFKQLK